MRRYSSTASAAAIPFLERHGFAEEGFVVVRMALQKAVVGVQRFVMQAQLHQAGAQGQMRLAARRIVRDGFAERSGGLLPTLDAPLAYAGVEVRGGMQRLQQRRLRVALRRRTVLLQFVLQLAEREEQRRVTFAAIQRAHQFLGGFVEFAVQMQRGRLRQHAADARFLRGSLAVFRASRAGGRH